MTTTNDSTQDKQLTKELLRSEGALTRLILEQAIMGNLKKENEAFKSQVSKAFKPGESSKVKNAQGLDIGSVSKSAPNKKAVCNDQSIVLAMAIDKGYDIHDALPVPGSDKAAELVDYLFENAPQFLESSISAPDLKEMSDEVLENHMIKGELPAGWEIVEASSPSFRVTPGRSAAAKAAIEHLLTQVEGLLPAKPKELEK